MIRRDFMKDLALAGAGFLCAPIWKNAAALPAEASSPAGNNGVPALDDLAGDWFSGELFEQTPSICNFHGGIQASRNILGISSFANFPLAQGGELGQLLLGGVEVKAEDFRWYAYQMLRRGRVQNLDIITTVRMPFEASGVLFQVQVTNSGADVRKTGLSVKLETAIREYQETWHWDPPRPESKDFPEFHAELLPSDGKALRVRDTHSNSTVVFAFVQPPDKLSAEDHEAEWDIELQPGESRQIEFVMAASTDAGEALSHASRWKTHFNEIFREAKEKWEQRFADAFRPNNGHFSGNLPTLQTEDGKLRRLYYMSILSVLELERTNLHADFPRVIITAGPRWAPTLVYFWDTGLFPTLFSLLDPDAVKQLLTLFLSTDIHSCYAIDVPSLKGVGPWYAFNDYVIFQMCLTYICVTGDWGFLNQEVAGKKVIDRMEDSALYWRKLVSGDSPLASYGTPDNLLETVPTYQQRVPSLNAANVWMMRTAAKLRARNGEGDRARSLEQQANELLPHVLDLYVAGKGYWACRFDGGQRVEVRHCIDFFTAIFCLKDDLGEQRTREMAAFVERELWTRDWLYALSPLDGAAKESLRPDHGSTGSFDAWPAFTAAAMFEVAERENSLEHLRNIDPVMNEGPFGQAHFCADGKHPTRKAVSMDYYESSAGAGFAEITIRTIFGFSPGLEEEWKWTAPRVRGFQGQLINVRFKGKLLSREIST